MTRGQVEALIPMVQNVAGQADITFADLDLIATTIGPGAFTGLRIGMSAARGFALSLDKPLIGFTTLQVLAQQFANEHEIEADQQIGVILETKRSDFYCQIFDAKACAISAPQAMESPEMLDNTHYIGDAVERFREQSGAPRDIAHFHERYHLPDPQMLARMAYDTYRANGADIGNMPAPLYLRAPDVSQPKSLPRSLAK